jgi:hypothetical protein
MLSKIRFGSFLFVLVFLLGNVTLAQERASLMPRFLLKLTGGLFQAAAGDMNTHLRSMHDYYHRYYQPEGYGEIATLGWSGEWQLELIWDASSKIRWGLATHLARFKNESTFMGADVQEYQIDHEITFKPQIDVVAPAKLSIYYSLYSSPKINILVHSGVGMYSAKMKEEKIHDVIYPYGDIYYDNRSWSVKRRLNFGWHGGVSAEYGLVRNLAVVAELQGRYLKISNLRGSVEYTTNFGGGRTIKESGILRYFGSDQDYYDLDIPLPCHPCVLGNEIYIERKAVLNLSGISFRLGIEVGIF